MSVDGSSYNPMNANNVDGANDTFTSEGVNDSIDVKVIAVPPKQDRSWHYKYPEGAILFGTTAEFQKDMAHAQIRGRAHFFRQIDCMETFTPEQMCYQIHLDWINGEINAADHPQRILTQLYEKYHCLGVNTLPPEDSHGVKDSVATRRLGNDRVLNIRIAADDRVLNYWGSKVGGSTNCYLFFVLRFVEVQSLRKNTISYTLSRDGTDVRTVDLFQRTSNGTVTNTRMEYLPRWEAVCSENPRCPNDEDLYYMYEGVRLRGKFVRVGRCVVNKEFQQNPHGSRVTEINDMMLTSNISLIDVLVRINDGYYLP